MTISVLIPTLGREDVVIGTVESLLTQTRMPDEIVLADQNDPPQARLDAFLASCGRRVRHLRSRTRGVVFNMNLLLREARGDVVLFVDDDIIPIPTLVEAHLANYELSMSAVGRNASMVGRPLGGVAGRILNDGDPDPVTVRRTGHYGRWSGRVVGAFNALERKELQHGGGGNISFLRHVLLEVGGFDLGFDGNAFYFEPDACMRVIAAGYRIVFDPHAELRHLMAPSGGARIHDRALLTAHRIRNGVRLYRRHSPALGLPLYVAQMVGYAALKAAYRLDPRILVLGLKALGEGLARPLEFRSNLGVIENGRDVR